MIDVLPVTDRRLSDLYIDLPFRLYRHDPLWMPPLRGDIRKLMSPKKNPLFAEAAIEHFVAFNEQATRLFLYLPLELAHLTRMHAIGQPNLVNRALTAQRLQTDLGFKLRR